MKKPTVKEISSFLRKEFPDFNFDEIKIIDNTMAGFHFEIISNGHMIAQAKAEIDEYFWQGIKTHLKWQLGL